MEVVTRPSDRAARAIHGCQRPARGSGSSSARGEVLLIKCAPFDCAVSSSVGASPKRKKHRTGPPATGIPDLSLQPFGASSEKCPGAGSDQGGKPCLFRRVTAYFPLLNAPPDKLCLPALFWITGLPAAGKTTLAWSIHGALRKRGVPVVVLDGDDLRQTISADLGYSGNDRRENVRRIGEIARVLLSQSFTVVVACISPFRDQRDALRRSFASGQFIEVLADTSPEICRRRDPKGLYRLAAKGELREMTGVDSTYEPPLTPEFAFKPDEFDMGEMIERIRFRAVSRESSCHDTGGRTKGVPTVRAALGPTPEKRSSVRCSNA